MIVMKRPNRVIVIKDFIKQCVNKIDSFIHSFFMAVLHELGQNTVHRGVHRWHYKLSVIEVLPLDSQ